MRTQNVLLLGEGDYSFCHDLCKVFAADEEAALSFHVIATSFDQRHELLEKYSAVEKILTTIKSNGRATVAYGIDATKDLKAQLIATFCETTTFDHIIFNFPHLGYENLKSHSSLIAHVLYRYLLDLHAMYDLESKLVLHLTIYRIIHHVGLIKFLLTAHQMRRSTSHWHRAKLKTGNCRSRSTV